MATWDYFIPWHADTVVFRHVTWWEAAVFHHMLRGQLSFAMICCEAASLPHDVLGTIRSIQFERWYLHASSYVNKTTIWWVCLQWLCTLQLIFTIIIITADKPLRIKFCYHSYSEAAIAMKNTLWNSNGAEISPKALSEKARATMPEAHGTDYWHFGIRFLVQTGMDSWGFGQHLWMQDTKDSTTVLGNYWSRSFFSVYENHRNACVVIHSSPW